MARVCSICKKGGRVDTVRKLLRGNYNPTTLRKKNPNLQWVRLPTGEKIKACTNCIKSIHKKAK
ncbi:50S ribosomal protein L28 [Candidatus Parcubacteria bacterium]|nr:MAG: 50S ribosomal protein L28 [Candidatus Parcubacteria bacterium]